MFLQYSEVPQLCQQQLQVSLKVPPTWAVTPGVHGSSSLFITLCISEYGRAVMVTDMVPGEKARMVRDFAEAVLGAVGEP